VLHARPPSDLPPRDPDAADAERVRGREVWLVHPWALRAPPPDLADDAVIVGVYLREHHEAWPWSATRWRWVDEAMGAIAPHRWVADAARLRSALAGAACVRSVDDPHLCGRLDPIARLDPAPALFPVVTRPCSSFSQWWRRATQGLARAEELV
jgi:deoxyribodipyrimidine photo-lyase